MLLVSAFQLIKIILKINEGKIVSLWANKNI